jgi:hypothetical protein
MDTTQDSSSYPDSVRVVSVTSKRETFVNETLLLGAFNSTIKGVAKVQGRVHTVACKKSRWAY